MWTDLGKEFAAHPVTGDVLAKHDAEAVSQSIVGLVSTDQGERPFQPYVGCNIKTLLFEPFGISTANMIRQIITETIQAYEPRANLTNVQVDAIHDLNTYHVEIFYTLVGDTTAEYSTGVDLSKEG